jgi:hypothetical protein
VKEGGRWDMWLIICLSYSVSGMLYDVYQIGRLSAHNC